MKRLFSALMVALLLSAGTLPAHAQSEVTYSDNVADSDAVVVDWVASQDAQSTAVPPEPSTSIPASDLPDTTAAAEPAAAALLQEASPIAPEPGAVVSSTSSTSQNSEAITENGAVLIKKTYELSPETDPELMVEDFEQDGYRFTLREILPQELPGETLTCTASKVAVTTTDSNDQEAILAQFPAYIEHAEDGYTGRLALDASSICTVVEEYETYSYSYTKTEEITGLSSNDPALISKARAGMTLVDISFRESGSTYTAVLTWLGVATGQRPVSYTTTASYSGQVSQTVPGNILYTYIYEGTPLIEEDTPAVEPPAQMESAAELQPAQESSVSNSISLKNVLLILIGVAYPVGLTLLFVTHTRKERKLRRENREALEEIARFIRGEA
ncbi:hypothetical protein LJC63_00285 [Ruminococcaceae bacterium OttesenSCG-928-L11]|nr:hypothetical protein [Ruminococcaceae bacterium OttesenSCG-928-L11]